MEDLLIALGQVQDELNNIIRALKESNNSRRDSLDSGEYDLAKAKILELTLRPVLCN
jgi:hypothetical protein